MDLSFMTKPELFGPGLWMKIHLDALAATNDNLKWAFIHNINYLCDNFRCAHCIKHFRHFIDTHPLSNYWYISTAYCPDIGFFQWTWELHNAVNMRLHKYIPTLEEAYKSYTTISEPCTNCGAKDDLIIISRPY